MEIFLSAVAIIIAIPVGFFLVMFLIFLAGAVVNSKWFRK